MDKISIDNLFPNIKFKNRPLDVYSLYNPKEIKKEDDISYNIQNLRNVREENKRKIEQVYMKVYEDCLKDIIELNKKNKTDMIYDIPLVIFGKEYDNIDCIKYINKRLIRLNMETIILSGERIYISWSNI